MPRKPATDRLINDRWVLSDIEGRLDLDSIALRLTVRPLYPYGFGVFGRLRRRSSQLVPLFAPLPDVVAPQRLE